MKRILTASIATLGCKLNQSESDRMARQLADVGVRIVPFDQPADLYVVNSCTVTHVGDRKSRQMIRQAVRSNPEAFIVVGGCYAEMEPEAVMAIEGVDAVLRNDDKERLVEVLMGFGVTFGDGDLDSLERARGHIHVLFHEGREYCSPIGEGPEALSRPRTRAFVKIQEGCDNYCTYCIVPMARGHRRSRPSDEVVREIRRLVSEGYREVVLTGVNITTYGCDYGSIGGDVADVRGLGLFRLIEKILAETDVCRVRLSSLQPEDWSDRFYELWESGRMCRHLHLSLQSGSDAVLKRMRRRYNVGEYTRLVAHAQRALPGVAITTDVIVGFPGESEAEFLETEDLLRSLGMAGFHVFKYSPRTGTAAAKMPNQVDPRVKQERSDRLISLARECEEKFRASLIGSTLDVLWENRLTSAEVRKLGGLSSRCSWWAGLSDNYVRVYAQGPEGLSGLITKVRLERSAADGAIATIIKSPKLKLMGLDGTLVVEQ